MNVVVARCIGLENRPRENEIHEQHNTCEDGTDALAPGLRAQWPELAEVVRAWPKLPAPIRSAIIQLCGLKSRRQVE